ncbi:hypothetical protein V8C40DRAFT_191694 [Trichoderma camerunense]
MLVFPKQESSFMLLFTISYALRCNRHDGQDGGFSLSLRLCSQGTSTYLGTSTLATLVAVASARSMPHMLNFPLLELMIQYLSRLTRLDY